VKIAPSYSHPVVHVLDASRAVSVAASLKDPKQRKALDEKNRSEQERLRQKHRDKTAERPLLSLEEARRRRTPLDWESYAPPRPSFTGLRVLNEYPLREIVPFIDWSPFFATWELRGTYPRIFENETWGDKAKEVFDDAQALLARIVEEGRLTARGVYGFFPAQARGDDIEVYLDESRSRMATVFHMLRQQNDKPEGQPNQSLSDFVAPAGTGRPDYLGAFAVTTGIGVESLVEEFQKQHDDYGAIMAKALADRLAEAFTELVHKTARAEWGYGRDEQLTPAELIRERYRGIRPAPGYPACPDHSEKGPLFDLLQAEKNAGIVLTETFAMNPGAAVCGFFLSHPEARYFTVGRIGHDQADDYCRRKGADPREVERWLAPVLDAESAEVAR
jgi:5-methyltetrahydrofolate--homocysteine methyltransferase